MQVKTVLDIPPALAQGLAEGIYTRSGGTVRHAQSGKIVALLRDTAPVPDLLSGLSAISGVITLGVSVLNLGVSVAGFAAVIDQMGRLEQELQSTKEALLKSNQELSRKIDLSFYANFAAALKLAQATFTMSDVENRKASAFQAINRFLEAEEVYYGVVKELLENRVRGSEQYLQTLALAYFAEFRCYLELGETRSALHRLQESLIIFRFLTEGYVKTMLTWKPSVYLHPEVQDEISLTRLTNIIRWLKPDEAIDENAVFQKYRKEIFTVDRELESWKNTIPDAVKANLEIKSFPATLKQLPPLMVRMEAMIETFQRLEAYQEEVQIMQQLGLSFSKWQELSGVTPPDATEQRVVCLLMPEPIAV